MTKLEILLNIIEINGLKFLILEEEKEFTWKEAKAYAKSLRGRLPTIKEFEAAYATGLRFKGWSVSETVDQSRPYSFVCCFEGSSNISSFIAKNNKNTLHCIILTEEL